MASKNEMKPGALARRALIRRLLELPLVDVVEGDSLRDSWKEWVRSLPQSKNQLAQEASEWASERDAGHQCLMKESYPPRQRGTIRKDLENLERDWGLCTTLRAFPYQTDFFHEYRINIAFDSRGLQKRALLTKEFADAPSWATRYAGRFGMMLESRDSPDNPKKHPWSLANAPVPGVRLHEQTLVELVSLLQNTPWMRRHIVVLDAALAHGTPDHTAELSVVTDDGMRTLGRVVREVLPAFPGVRQSRTIQISWRLSQGGSPEPLFNREDEDDKDGG